MTRKSYGKMRGSRKKLAAKRISINRFLENFDVGEHVSIDIYSGSAFPHPRFHGKTGVVKQRRGSGYAVQIHDGRKAKTLFLKPEHLRRQA